MSSGYFEDIRVGDVEESAEFVADEAEMVAYARIHDPFAIHVDAEAAANSPFGGIIAPFGYVVGLFFRAAHTMHLNSDFRDAFLGALEWRVRFAGPVRPGDRIRVRTTVTGVRRASSGNRGVVTSTNDVVNHHGETSVSIEIVSLVAARPA